MTPLFLYLLKSGLSLAVLVLFYELVQKREVFFHFNRAYLLLGLAIALLLPFWDFNFLSFFTEEASAQNYLVTYQVSNFQLPEVVIGGSETTQSGFSLVSLLVYVYLTGVLLKTAQLLFRTISLIRLTKKSKATRNDRAKVIFTEGDLAVFSFQKKHLTAMIQKKLSRTKKFIFHNYIHWICCLPNSFALCSGLTPLPICSKKLSGKITSFLPTKKSFLPTAILQLTGCFC